MDSDHDGGIDLHIHTTASDGSHTPAEVLQMAARQGLRAVAITDHDTIDGARMAIEGQIPEALDFLPGVEISTNAPARFASGDGLHILGYGIDVTNEPLKAALGELQKARNERIPKIVDRLNRNGIAIRMEQIQADVGAGVAGRPHVAGVLMKMGCVSSINEAFDRYLGKNGPAYVSKERLSCGRAFDLIRQAGGVPVLAHPILIKFGSADDLNGLLDVLCDLGLQGIEVYYPQHPPESVALFLDLARKYDLLVTGGTDFHGKVTPGIQLGCGKGRMHIPYSLYEKLISVIKNTHEAQI